MTDLDVLYVSRDADAVGALLAAGPESTGIEVLTAPADATARLRGFTYDVVVVDRAQTAPDTAEFLRNLRTVPADCPILVDDLPARTILDAARRAPASEDRDPERGALTAGAPAAGTGDAGGNPSAVGAASNVEERAESPETDGPLRMNDGVDEPLEGASGEEFVDAVLENLVDLYFVFDMGMNFVDWNPRLNELTGKSDEEIVEMTPFDIVADHDHELAREKITEVLAQGEGTAEFDLVAGDGEVIPYEFTGSLIAGSQGGSRSYICGIGRDLRRVRQREAELREQRDLVNRILKTARVAIVIIDADGTVTRVNPAAERLLGLNQSAVEAELVDFTEWTFVDESGDPVPPAEHPVVQVQATHEAVHRSTYGVEDDDDTRRWLSTSTAPLYDDDGDFDGSVTVMEDVTELKQQERSRRERTEELNEALEELRRSNAELERFAYAISHDLKEPLRMITNYLQLLDRRYGDDLDEDAAEFVDIALDGADRMRGRIDALLTYSRVGRGDDAFEPVDLESVLTRALSNLDVAIDESDATVEVGSLPTVVGDAEQLVRLFQNLVGNAVEHGSDAPTVEIDAEREGDELILTVADDGPGIPAEQVDRVFDLFYSGGGDSTGVGLAICQKIVSNHDGRIWVDSESDAGTTFSMALPVRETE